MDIISDPSRAEEKKVKKVYRKLISARIYSPTPRLPPPPSVVVMPL